MAKQIRISQVGRAGYNPMKAGRGIVKGKAVVRARVPTSTYKGKVIEKRLKKIFLTLIKSKYELTTLSNILNSYDS